MTAHRFFSFFDMHKSLVETVVYSQGARAPSILVSLARVSKAFNDPALDALWRRLSNVAPLLQLLPSDVYQHGALVRPLEPSDFLLFEKYTYRVREFCASSGRENEHLLQLAALQSPLFPRLQELRWSTHMLDVLDIVPLLCPSLQTFRTSLSRHNQTSDMRRTIVIRLLPSLAPNLTSLTLRAWDMPMKGQVLLDAIPHLLTIEDFSYEAYITGELLIALSNLPRLRKLTIWPELGISLKGFGSGSFPVLEDISINGCTDDAANFLPHVNSSRLRKFCLGPSTISSSPVPWTTALQTWHSGTISEIAMNWSHEEDTPYNTARSVIKSLISCPHLEVVALMARVFNFGISNSDLEAVATSWPRLRSLRLGENHCPAVPRPMVTLYGLNTFVENCPQLESLSVAVDASALSPHVRPGPSVIFSPSCLRSLNLFYSPCGNPKHVAEYLQMAFPRLQDLRAARWDGDGSDEPVGDWGDVKALLRAQRTKL